MTAQWLAGNLSGFLSWTMTAPAPSHYNVVAFGKQGHFAKPLHKGTLIKLVIQAQSQPDNIATLPLLTATFVRSVRPAARG